MRTMRGLLFTTALGVGVLAMAVGANAGQITFGPSNENVTYTGNGNNTLTVGSTGLTGLAHDSFGGNGTFSLSGFALTTGTPTIGNFPILTANTETFTYTSGLDFITEDVTLTNIVDNSPTPSFEGTDVVTGGSPNFLNLFGPAGSTSVIDMTSNTLSTVLVALALTQNTETNTISSGETVITPVSTPEPGSLTLLGTALLGLGWIGWRRKRA